MMESKSFADSFSGINNSEASPEPEWIYDPNEPRYCICNQVSYGDMVACDNADVRILLYFKTKFTFLRILYIDLPRS